MFNKFIKNNNMCNYLVGILLVLIIMYGIHLLTSKKEGMDNKEKNKKDKNKKDKKKGDDNEDIDKETQSASILEEELSKVAANVETRLNMVSKKNKQHNIGIIAYLDEIMEDYNLEKTIDIARNLKEGLSKHESELTSKQKKAKKDAFNDMRDLFLMDFFKNQVLNQVVNDHKLSNS